MGKKQKVEAAEEAEEEVEDLGEKPRKKAKTEPVEAVAEAEFQEQQNFPCRFCYCTCKYYEGIQNE